VVLFFAACIFSCAKSNSVCDGFRRGMYEGLNQVHEMEHTDETPQQGEETPAYDQYQRERQEIVTDSEEH
jgi:hypothetical protein